MPRQVNAIPPVKPETEAPFVGAMPEDAARIMAKAALFAPPPARLADGRRDLVGLSREELAAAVAEHRRGALPRQAALALDLPPGRDRFREDVDHGEADAGQAG